MDKKSVVILIGPPGSGKGTQAEFLSEKFNLFHLETSKLGEAKINAPELVKKDPETAEAKRQYDMGQLFPPPWTTKMVAEKIVELSGKNIGIVFSGSPRTLYEAENELPVLEKSYGKENIKVINISLSEEESVKRNTFRRICKANRHPIPNFPEFEDVKICPKDGSELITRTVLDAIPEKIRFRYQVYKERTEPVLAFLREKDYNIIEINGEQSIENVQKDILDKLND
mgnify:FL=1